MRRLAREIYSAVADGKLSEPFTGTDLKEAGIEAAKSTYAHFLSKHRVGNGATTELFLKAESGFGYRTTDAGWKRWEATTGQKAPHT